MISYYLAKKIDRVSRSPFVAYIFIGIKKLVDKFSNKIVSDVETLYVVKLLGGGSLCILLPYLAELKSKKDIRLVLVSTKVCTVFSNDLKIFDASICLDTYFGVCNFLKLSVTNLFCRLLGKNRSASINFEFHSAVTAYISSLLFSPVSCGVMNNLSLSFSGIYDKTTFYNGHANVGVVYAHLLLNIFNRNDIYPTDKCNSAIAEYVRAVEMSISLDKLGVSSEFVAVSPFSSGLSPERELSTNQMVATLVKLNPHCKPIYILGSNADVKRADILMSSYKASGARASIVSLCGALTISASAKLARESQLYITIDSGLNHYIRMTTARLIHSYWGPTDPNIMLDNTFFCGDELIHYKKVYCSPCVHIVDKAPCGGRNVCIEGICTNVE